MSSVEAQKRQLYNRQEYVVGAETQAKYGSTDVLVVGASGLGAEIVKNLALMGVRSIKVCDDAPVQIADLSANFFLQESDVGKPRGAIVAAAAKELNRFVEVTATPAGANVMDLIPHVQVVVFANHYTASLTAENAKARACGVKFISSESRGVAGCVFVDAGDSFDVLDPDGEETVTCVVTAISSEGLVTLHDDKSHECAVGDQVYLTGLVSPAGANTDIASGSQKLKELKLFEVSNVVSPYILQLKGFTELLKDGTQVKTGTSAYLHTTKRRMTMSFKDLASSVVDPDFAMIFDSEAKFDAPTTLHAIFRAVAHMGKCPTSAAEVTEAIALAKTLTPAGLSAADLNDDFARQVLPVFGGDLNPMACFIGGLAAQEALKLCSGKFTPIHQWLYYDAREILQARGGTPDEWLSTESVAPNRFSNQMAVMGPAFQEFLATQRAFIVGAGALGCELIKNAALIGLGGVSITDMDQIEMSNLSRQFLFRDRHIGQSKSTVAAAAAQSINPRLHITAYEEKMAPETEGVFNEQFWAQHHVVLNALDNVASRKYVDERCLFYKRPLFESGTLGTKCNMQPVITFVTESYSNSYDPPERSIPLCTLKNFPSAIEHTIQWARDQFHLLYNSTPADVNAYLENPEGFEAQLARDPAAAGVALKQVNEALRTWPTTHEDCVSSAFLMFNQYFCENFRQLLHNIPLDKRNEDGQLFWSGAKKPPTALTYNPQDEQHIEFVYSTACLLAEICGLPPLSLTRQQVAGMSATMKAPAFVARSVAFATSEKDKSDPSAAQLAGELTVRDLPPASQFTGRRMKPLEFEKDDATNHHVEFITYCSNLRAIAYGIPPADLVRTKRIAGKIIPAMVTTTSLVTGLVGFEMLKYFLIQFRHTASAGAAAAAGMYVPTRDEVNMQLSLYRSAFVNIALPFVAFSDPIIANGRTYVRPSGATLHWTVWDRLDVIEGRDISVNELVKLLEDRYELETFMITLASGKMIYTQFGGRKADKEKAVSVVAQEKGEVPQDGDDFLNLVATGVIGEEDDVDVPIIRYKYRNF